MPKITKSIEIVRSAVPGLSSMGSRSAAMIQSVLEQYYDQVDVSLVSDLSDLERLADRRPDLVILGVKRVPASIRDTAGAKVWMPAYLDEQGLAYTGSTASAIALDFSKPAAKRLLADAGLATAAYFTARPGEYNHESALPLAFPLFVKPPAAGGGKGIGPDSVVRDFAAFTQRVDYVARNFNSSALVETYLPGREFSVAVLESLDSDELLAMPIELVTPRNDRGDRILGVGIKEADTEQIIAVPDGPTKQAIIELAIQAFHHLGARDYGRIDIRLDEKGTPHFLEANLIPGIAQHTFTSYFTAAAHLNQAMDYETMILHITELGLMRSSNELLNELPADTLPSALTPTFEAV